MSYDKFHYDGKNPVYERSAPEPKYKTLFFTADIEDDLDDMCAYTFTGAYYDHDNRIRIVEAKLGSFKKTSWFPVISDENDWHWILRTAIAEELGVEEDAVIFECKIQIK